jgi:hypothetical protein
LLAALGVKELSAAAHRELIIEAESPELRGSQLREAVEIFQRSIPNAQRWLIKKAPERYGVLCDEGMDTQLAQCRIMSSTLILETFTLDRTGTDGEPIAKSRRSSALLERTATIDNTDLTLYLCQYTPDTACDACDACDGVFYALSTCFFLRSDPRCKELAVFLEDLEDKQATGKQTKVDSFWTKHNILPLSEARPRGDETEIAWELIYQPRPPTPPPDDPLIVEAEEDDEDEDDEITTFGSVPIRKPKIVPSPAQGDQFWPANVTATLIATGQPSAGTGSEGALGRSAIDASSDYLDGGHESTERHTNDSTNDDGSSQRVQSTSSPEEDGARQNLRDEIVDRPAVEVARSMSNESAESDAAATWPSPHPAAGSGDDPVSKLGSDGGGGGGGSGGNGGGGGGGGASDHVIDGNGGFGTGSGTGSSAGGGLAGGLMVKLEEDISEFTYVLDQDAIGAELAAKYFDDEAGAGVKPDSTALTDGIGRRGEVGNRAPPPPTLRRLSLGRRGEVSNRPRPWCLCGVFAVVFVCMVV